MSGISHSRRPGRPVGDAADAVRGELIAAARALCIEVGLDAATTKAIARRAGVNPAMINYYFGSKEGLCRAMMQASMQPILDELDAAERAAADFTLEHFVRGYMTALSRNPWLPQIVVREVLPANGRCRELFFDVLAARAAKLLPSLVQRAAAAGQIDAALDPRLVIVSIVSLAVFPFLAAPVVEHGLDVSPGDEKFAAELIAHSTRLLARGLAPGARS